MKYARVRFLLIKTTPGGLIDVKAFSDLDRLAEYIYNTAPEIQIKHLEPLKSSAFSEMQFCNEDGTSCFDIIRVQSITHNPRQ